MFHKNQWIMLFFLFQTLSCFNIHFGFGIKRVKIYSTKEWTRVRIFCCFLRALYFHTLILTVWPSPSIHVCVVFLSRLIDPIQTEKAFNRKQCMKLFFVRSFHHISFCFNYVLLWVNRHHSDYTSTTYTCIVLLHKKVHKNTVFYSASCLIRFNRITKIIGMNKQFSFEEFVTCVWGVCCEFFLFVYLKSSGGDQSLGFTIDGGSDEPLFHRSFIFIIITRIFENGLAHRDKRLR
jgi:hypothetical protein